MKVGFVGWRGMVGSVLMQRMKEENDFAHIPEAFFFTTSNVGGAAPDFGQAAKTLLDANDVAELAKMDIIVTCQGGDYTKSVFQPLRDSGWNGYWVDAASSLRMKNDAIIVLDPVNRNVIDNGLKNGVKNYIGGNGGIILFIHLEVAGFQSDDLAVYLDFLGVVVRGYFIGFQKAGIEFAAFLQGLRFTVGCQLQRTVFRD